MTNPTLITLDDILRAEERIRGVAVHTPLVCMDDYAGPGRLWIKAESLQPIGSFKLRGAYNKIALLGPEQRRHGVITYSSGNHAQGVAYAARALGIRATIVMPSNAPMVKRQATEALGAEIVTVGPSSSERKYKAEELALEFGYVMVPPYDDAAIIAGQGTCGMEILEDLPDVDLVLIPVGGGGLISGVATAVKLSRPSVKVFGVEPEMASDAAESMRTGKIVSRTAEQSCRTIADGLRAQSIGMLNFAHIQAFVDGIRTVTEMEIRNTMRRILSSTGLVAEPSGAVASAAALYHAADLPPFQNAVAVMSGGNIDPDLLRQLEEEVKD